MSRHACSFLADRLTVVKKSHSAPIASDKVELVIIVFGSIGVAEQSALPLIPQGASRVTMQTPSLPLPVPPLAVLRVNERAVQSLICL